MNDDGVIDLLRSYTGPRGLLVALLFVAAALVRLPAVVFAVFVHLLERTSERLLAAIGHVDPQPIRKQRDQHRRAEQ